MMCNDEIRCDNGRFVEQFVFGAVVDILRTILVDNAECTVIDVVIELLFCTVQADGAVTVCERKPCGLIRNLDAASAFEIYLPLRFSEVGLTVLLSHAVTNYRLFYKCVPPFSYVGHWWKHGRQK